MSRNLSKNHWLKQANCKDVGTKIFTSFDRESIEQAKALCRTCPVKTPCLVENFDTPWVVAGMSRFERLSKIWHRIEDEEENNFDYY